MTVVSLCSSYSTSGHPSFHPVCLLGRSASLACHSPRPACLGYASSVPRTVVVNCHTEPFDVKIDRTTVFGNPFKIGQHGDRAEVIRRFESYFYHRIEKDPEWLDKVLLLDGKRLGCHCKPQPCHGDVYAAFLETRRYLAERKLGLEV